MYCPFVVMIALLASTSIFSTPKTRYDKLFLALSTTLGLWLVFEMLIYVVKDQFWLEYLFTVKLVFTFCAPALFLFLILEFYNLWRPSARWARLLILVVPAIIVVLSLESPLYNMLVTSLQINTDAIPTSFQVTYSPIYYIAFLFAQTTVVGIAAIVLIQRRKLPPEYRGTTSLFALVLVVYMFGAIIQFSGVLGGSRIQTTLIALCVALLLIYIIVASNGRPDYLNIWRRDVFDYLEEAIFIIDDNRQVTSMNKAGIDLFDSFDIKQDDLTIDELDEAIYSSDRAFRRELPGSLGEAEKMDIYLMEGKYPRIYEVLYKPVPDSLGVGQGQYQILTEVTRNRLFIERLRDIAGIDVLTGLKNRYTYEQIMHEWDASENLPLSLIIGDVNGLKQFNDTYGHKVGDDYLKSVSAVLEAVCPKEGFVARIGGDEFVMVVKNCSSVQAHAYIQQIEQQMTAVQSLPETASIALGSATKVKEQENINALYAQADEFMYQNKQEGYFSC